LQKPPKQPPVQQSALVLHAPPSGEQLCPDEMHTPLRHTPPVQQSLSAVQVPLPMGMQLAEQAKPVGELGLGTHTREQHSSAKLQGVGMPPVVSGRQALDDG
jgi:hypothetical protein